MMSQAPVNPESTGRPTGSSYWSLLIRAKVIRAAAALGFALHRLTHSLPSPSSTVWVDSTLGTSKAKKAIRLDIYDPDTGSSSTNRNTGRPAVIVFHGGGFVLGSGTDDASYAASLTVHGIVVVAVSYRLAPEYPYPTPLEDCASAILHIHQNSDQYGIDPSRLYISGFSAGGNLALACLHLFNNPTRFQYDLPPSLPAFQGGILFYPLLDWTKSRESKRSTCERPELTLPTGLTNLFDESYLRPDTLDLTDPLLSPGAASDEYLKALPPIYLVLCEHDMLRHEGDEFASKLKGLGKEISERLVEGERHGWDKVPFAVKDSVGVEYQAAWEVLEAWIRRGESRADTSVP
jgi:acetyl esterase/lipase